MWPALGRPRRLDSQERRVVRNQAAQKAPWYLRERPPSAGSAGTLNQVARSRLASSKTARLRPMPKRVRAPPNGHKRGLRLSGKFVVLRYFTHNEPYMKSHQRDPLVFSGLVSFWVKFRKVRFGPDPVTRQDVPLGRLYTRSVEITPT